jgi:carbon-monoxide dehydrogenase medium subunit
MVGLAVALTMDGKTIRECALSFMAMDDKPVLAPSAMKALTGQQIHPESILLAQNALDTDLDPPGDLQANASTKKHLARVLLSRALIQAGESHV